MTLMIAMLRECKFALRQHGRPVGKRVNHSRSFRVALTQKQLTPRAVSDCIDEIEHVLIKT